MNTPKVVEEAKSQALEVLLHNARSGRDGLPRTAGFGYPEPHTRDLLVTALGSLVTGNRELIDSQRLVLQTLAGNQSALGHIPSLVDVPSERGASDTTPLFSIALALFQRTQNEPEFLAEAAERAHVWMCYQSPEDDVIVTQPPASDWRNEQWVEGSGLFVNALLYTALSLRGERARVTRLDELLTRFDVRRLDQPFVHERFVSEDAPYFALWSHQQASSERFDLLGNSLAILNGMASPERATRIVAWVERECAELRRRGELAVELPPNLFPYILPADPDWRARYGRYNRPGCGHNGGLWPFVCGFYVSALVAAGELALAEQKLSALAELVRPCRAVNKRFGFNEWLDAQSAVPRGQDWQSWSAAMFLYAAECVERGSTPFFDALRADAHPR